MKIYYHPQFKKSYQKLPNRIKTAAEAREAVFRKDYSAPQLQTHKLHGRLKNQWSFSVSGKYRIIFEFFGQDVIFLDIGSHDLYE
jgi:addiction module RelE/StbE family toxin